MKNGEDKNSFGKNKVMQKILLAIDAVNINMPALDFACYIGRLTNSKITAVFLENLVADENPFRLPR